MSESGDYTPGPWKGHDFGKAKAHYDVHVGRSYADAKTTGKTHKDLRVAKVSSKATRALIFVFDVTGSMGDWPKIIFSKLPYFDHEVKTEYLGKGSEICFAATGDANSDNYPLQVRPFADGTDLKKKLEELVIEGNGGGQQCETYELAALYFLDNADLPNADNPIIIFIGDEMPYDHINVSKAKEVAGVEIDKQISTAEVFKLLRQKYAVYFIMKPYGSNGQLEPLDSISNQVYNKWKNLVGIDHMALLPSADRVMDVVFGILANECGRIDYFKEELEGRQTKAQVATTYKALESIHRDSDDKKSEDDNPSLSKSRVPLTGHRGKRLMPRDED